MILNPIWHNLTNIVAIDIIEPIFVDYINLSWTTNINITKFSLHEPVTENLDECFAIMYIKFISLYRPL